MKKSSLDFLCKLEGYKTACKGIHWDAKNMSQHNLFDDVASKLNDFQDAVGEVEQYIDGVHLPMNKLKAIDYTVSTPQKFLEDLLKDTIKYYKSINGDDYIGIRSECETFINDIQRFIYLIKFTLHEERTIDVTMEQIKEAVLNGVAKFISQNS